MIEWSSLVLQPHNAKEREREKIWAMIRDEGIRARKCRHIRREANGNAVSRMNRDDLCRKEGRLVDDRKMCFLFATPWVSSTSLSHDTVTSPSVVRHISLKNNEMQDKKTNPLNIIHLVNSSFDNCDLNTPLLKSNNISSVSTSSLQKQRRNIANVIPSPVL